jgi:hypothetical protein
MAGGLSPKEQRAARDNILRAQALERMQAARTAEAALPQVYSTPLPVGASPLPYELDEEDDDFEQEVAWQQQMRAQQTMAAITHQQIAAQAASVQTKVQMAETIKEAKEQVERTIWDVFEDLLNSSGESFALFGGIYITDGIIKVIRTIKTFMPNLGGNFFLWKMVPMYAVFKGRPDEYRHLLVGSAIILTGILTMIFCGFILLMAGYVYSHPLEAAPYFANFGFSYIQNMIFGSF